MEQSNKYEIYVSSLDIAIDPVGTRANMELKIKEALKTLTLSDDTAMVVYRDMDEFGFRMVFEIVPREDLWYPNQDKGES